MKTLDERFVDDPCDDEETIRALVRGDAGGMNINDRVKCKSGFSPPLSIRADECSYLHVACYRCRLELVSLLVEAGADVNRRDSKGNTALHYACASNDDRLSTIEYFLSMNQFLVNEPGWRGQSPLNVACRQTNFTAVKCLLQHGADVNYCSDYALLPLHVACEHSTPDVLNCLLEHGADINTLGYRKMTCLHYAALNAQHADKLVEHLLRKGRSNYSIVNAQDDDGDTPLHVACEHRHLRAVQHLIDAGADVNIKDCCGSTCLHAAYDFDVDENDPDNVACIVQHLVNRPGMRPETVNAQDGEGQTALHRACEWRNIAAVKPVTAAGADVNIRDNEGRTCIRAALNFVVDEYNHDDVACIVQHLVNRPGMLPETVNAQDDEGQTALYRACHFGNIDAVKALTAAGADVNMRDSDGSTCLHQCLQNADDVHPDDTHLILRHLLTDIGVSPDTLDAKDRVKNTPNQSFVTSKKHKKPLASSRKVKQVQRVPCIIYVTSKFLHVAMIVL